LWCSARWPGPSPAVGYIIGFRAGWGVGNALFIATSLAVIVASASGGFAGAIALYETALGIGIAIGPLPGGTLGEISYAGNGTRGTAFNSRSYRFC
jgi:ACDE family multidrug resistance protein